MAELKPIKDAVDATNRVAEFFRQHYSFIYPVQARQEGGYWLVDVDVGAAKTIIVRARVNALTGDIVDYARVSKD